MVLVLRPNESQIAEFIISFEKKKNSKKAFHDYPIEQINKEENFYLQTTFFTLRNKINTKDKQFFMSYCDNLLKSTLPNFEKNSISNKNVNFHVTENKENEMCLLKMFKEIELFLDVKMEFSLKISSDMIYNNFVDQLWDEILNSRHFNMNINTKFNFTNFLENHQYKFELRNHKFEKIFLHERNSKKRFIENNDFNLQCEKKKKKDDFFQAEPKKEDIFQAKPQKK